GIAVICADDQVAQAVAVDISGRGDTASAPVICALAVDDEAAGSRRNGGEIDRAATGLAKNDVGTPGQAAGCGVTTIGPHNEIRETVAVQIAGACHAFAAAVTVALSVDHEAAGACRNGGKRNDAAIAAPENHVAAPDG